MQKDSQMVASALQNQSRTFSVSLKLKGSPGATNEERCRHFRCGEETVTRQTCCVRVCLLGSTNCSGAGWR